MKQFIKRILKKSIIKVSDIAGLQEIVHLERQTASDVRELLEVLRAIRKQTMPASPDQSVPSSEQISSSLDLPIPPPELHFLIAGNRNFGLSEFLEIGRGCSSNVINLLKKHNVEIDSLKAILDFGCGCGRVIRHFHSLKNTKVYGVDYDQRLIEWCKTNLTFAEFSVNKDRPPLVYSDAMFDCIYAFSVFTHFSEALQIEWIKELSRVLKPGGYLLFTTQGEAYAEHLPPAEKKRFLSGKAVVIKEDLSCQGACMAYHPHKYVRETLARGFEILDFFPGKAVNVSRGLIGQDVYFLKKPESG